MASFIAQNTIKRYAYVTSLINISENWAIVLSHNDFIEKIEFETLLAKIDITRPYMHKIKCSNCFAHIFSLHSLKFVVRRFLINGLNSRNLYKNIFSLFRFDDTKHIIKTLF